MANEANEQARFIESRLRVYVGREDVQRALVAYALGSETLPCLMTGPSGSGKSAAMARFPPVRFRPFSAIPSATIRLQSPRPCTSTKPYSARCRRRATASASSNRAEGRGISATAASGRPAARHPHRFPMLPTSVRKTPSLPKASGTGKVGEAASATRTGSARWVKPQRKPWDYTMFGNNNPVPAPVETIPLVIGKINGGKGGFNRWTINGSGFDEKAPPRTLQKGKRYRLIFDNQTDDAHPIHLHRNSFELTNVHGKLTGSILKDVVLVRGFKKIEVDVAPAMDGLTLFHCHQQLHMDYGFKLLFNVT